MRTMNWRHFGFTSTTIVLVILLFSFSSTRAQDDGGATAAIFCSTFGGDCLELTVCQEELGREPALLLDGTAIDRTLCTSSSSSSTSTTTTVEEVICCLPDETMDETTPASCDEWLLQESRRNQTWQEMIHTTLPCPCLEYEADSHPDFFQIAFGLFDNLEINHPGATICYRGPVGDHYGQQCCYAGPVEGICNTTTAQCRLLVDGPGAGTVDKYAANINVFDNRHDRVDVEPFNLCGWESYQKYRSTAPAGGSNCSDCSNQIADENASWIQGGMIKIDFLNTVVTSLNAAVENWSNITLDSIEPIESSFESSFAGNITVYTGLKVTMTLPFQTHIDLNADVLSCSCNDAGPTRKVALPWFPVQVETVIDITACALLEYLNAAGIGSSFLFLFPLIHFQCAARNVVEIVSDFLGSLNPINIDFQNCINEVLNEEIKNDKESAESVCVTGYLSNTETVVEKVSTQCISKLDLLSFPTQQQHQQNEINCPATVTSLPYCNDFWDNNPDYLPSRNSTTAQQGISSSSFQCCAPPVTERVVIIAVNSSETTQANSFMTSIQDRTGASPKQLFVQRFIESPQDELTIELAILKTSNDSHVSATEIVSNLLELKRGDQIGNAVLSADPYEDGSELDNTDDAKNGHFEQSSSTGESDSLRKSKGKIIISLLSVLSLHLLWSFKEF